MGDLQRFFKVTQRKYVGGSYGRSNEYEKMKDSKSIKVVFTPKLISKIGLHKINKNPNGTKL